MAKNTNKGICPNCFKVRNLTIHHVLPLRYFNSNDLKLYLCRECHDEIEEIITEEENGNRLNKNKYIQIAYLFIKDRGRR